MADREKMQMHDSMARDLMFEARSLLERGNRTEEDNFRMLYTACAAYYHFTQASREFGPAEWLISRCYVEMGNGREAVRHAERCMRFADASKNEAEIAWALEALARANAVMGDSHAAHNYFNKAKEAGTNLSNEQDRERFKTLFESGNWFGVA